ncbi:hypothetical protein [Hufsiella ginkgonis]|uniref:Adenylosuccinate lyase n=1 Tax=Hufsiella ginkgonis TaxID=2695274 RepID=A0A7K1Y001_9SPHI|nr:hypothetical protein [Hufsiella ginkgonis]MXV16594.1 hypothetical protein [Hufsiella ginkgonis]
MDTNWLTDTIKTAIGKKRVLQAAARFAGEELPVTRLLELTFAPEKEQAFRAAWILEHLATDMPDAFQPGAEAFLDRYPEQRNLICQRHYCRIMMEIAGKKNGLRYKTVLEKRNLDPVIDATFEWLIQPGSPVAVQVNCLDILYLLRHRADWVTGELRLHIPFLLQGGSAAMQSRGKKVLAKL